MIREDAPYWGRRRRDIRGRRSIELEKAVRNWAELPEPEYLDGEAAEALEVDNLDLPESIRDSLRLAQYRQPADHSAIPEETSRIARVWVQHDASKGEWGVKYAEVKRNRRARERRGINRASQRLALVQDLLRLS